MRQDKIDLIAKICEIIKRKSFCEFQHQFSIHKVFLNFFLKEEEYQEQSMLCKNKFLLIEKIKEKILPALTSREVESLGLNLIGFSAKQIGEILRISFRTVETHLQQALHKLNCFSKLQCLEIMLEKKLLTMWQDLGKLLIKDYSQKKK